MLQDKKVIKATKVVMLVVFYQSTVYVYFLYSSYSLIKPISQACITHKKNLKKNFTFRFIALLITFLWSALLLIYVEIQGLEEC